MRLSAGFFEGTPFTKIEYIRRVILKHWTVPERGKDECEHLQKFYGYFYDDTRDFQPGDLLLILLLECDTVVFVSQRNKCSKSYAGTRTTWRIWTCHSFLARIFFTKPTFEPTCRYIGKIKLPFQYQNVKARPIVGSLQTLSLN